MTQNDYEKILEEILPDDSVVTIRMYDPGFGDCFLLAFRDKDNKPFFMLIDCGVHHMYPKKDNDHYKIEDVAKDIAKVTNNHLHLVVATHEHTDHLYGFKHAKGVFEDIAIDELWLAWTEDPTDTVVEELEQRWGKKKKALALSIQKIKPLNKEYAETLGNILFEDLEPFSAAKKQDTQLDFLRKITKKKLKEPSDYRRPGEPPLTLNGVKGVKVYVLGPPSDIEKIKKLKTEGELYFDRSDMDEGAAFAAAVFAAEGIDSMADEDSEFFDRSLPFDKSSMIPKDKARNHKTYGNFFKKRYGFNRGKKDDLEWRWINNDWMDAAGSLALSIQSQTNNTSLVLAIELTEFQPRKVLLFPGDAQVGNWLSWQGLSWPGEGEGGGEVTAKDLLGRTVLYKAGHHGSHNATLREKGLELMHSPDLVAMIPVDEEWAKTTQKWKHPAKKVLERLVEKTKGRIIRSDKIPLEKPKGATASQSEWKAFKANIKSPRDPKDLWIQYKITK